MSTDVERPARLSFEAAAITLPVSAVAARLGVAPATLRTWDRRYGLGPTEHAAGSHRRYAPQDVARLTLMQRALLRGASSADAAKYALEAESADLPTRIAESSLDTATSQAPRHTNDGTQANELASAALLLDTQAIQQQLLGSIADFGVTHTWEFVIRPILVVAGDRWANTGAGVEIEHALTECITAVLSHVMIEAGRATSGTPILLACMPGELHCLPLRALGAALAERGVPLTMLGSDTPTPAVVAAIQARQPSAVFLWAQMDRSVDLQLLTQLPPSRYVLGGAAWAQVPLPADARVAVNLAEAEDFLLALRR
ncbi:MAG: MerR family transcriptional regulator [Mycobacteriaceae bacterium]